MKQYILCVIALGFYHNLIAQISGTATDAESNPLPYVNIYIKNTSIGTTTNEEGKYLLNIDPGQYNIIYQYIGYKTVNVSVDLKTDPIEKNVILYPEKYSLDEVVISAQAEDPAYAIIRKAQAERQKYLDVLSNYSCNAYVRGFNKIVSAPDKIMGIDIGDLKGTLDPDGSGVVYLSESISTVHQKGDKIKEIMYSSKVSGDSEMYSFNSAKEMNFNFYEGTLNLNRDLVTPLAPNALSHYKYKLEGAYYEGSQLVNKIKVIPKNEFGNSFYGYVYINENLWNLHSLELSVTKHSTQIPFIDTLTFTQIFTEVQDESWAPLSNVISFTMNAFKVKVAGRFAAVYSNYKLGEMTDTFFNNEVYKVLEGSNERTEKYWDTLRPIPLTLEESLDYHRKDSIRILKESPEYLDSIDRVANKFSVGNLIGGYTFQNSSKRSSFSFSSPIGHFSLNTLQGWNSSIKIGQSKYFNKLETKSISSELDINYGLSDKKLRPKLRIDYQANGTNNRRLYLEGGQALAQYSRQNPITNRLNALYTLLFRQNYMKAYDKKYGAVGISQYITRGLAGSLSINYEERTALINTYKGGLQQNKRDFSSNNPQNETNNLPAFSNHQALILRAHLIIRIGQKLWTYPDQVFRENSKWPTIGLFYKAGLKVLGGDSDFHLVYASMSKEINLGIHGNTDIYLLGGGFLSESPNYFVDHLHFIGTQTQLAYPGEYSIRFLNLPYYSNSTGETFFQMHLQHNFQGYLISKIPLLKKTGWSLVGGYKLLASTDNNTYDEIHIGLDNIGIKLARLFRVDVVWSKNYQSEGRRQPAIVTGLKIPI